MKLPIFGCKEKHRYAGSLTKQLETHFLLRHWFPSADPTGGIFCWRGQRRWAIWVWCTFLINILITCRSVSLLWTLCPIYKTPHRLSSSALAFRLHCNRSFLVIYQIQCAYHLQSQTSPGIVLDQTGGNDHNLWVRPTWQGVWSIIVFYPYKKNKRRWQMLVAAEEQRGKL